MVHTSNGGLEVMNNKQEKMPEWIQNRSSRYRGRSGYRRGDTTIKESVLKQIHDTNSMLVISSFFLADYKVENAIKEKCNDGVQCYIMIAAETRLQQSIDNEFDKIAYDNHVNMLKKLSDSALIHTSSSFHAKAILTDPYSKNSSGLLLTANITEEGLERNQELCVKLNRDEITEIADVIRYMFWECAEHELDKDGNNLAGYTSLGEIKPPKSDHILQTSPYSKSIKEKILEILNENPKKVIISSYGWDLNPIVEKLCELAKKGSIITVISRAQRKQNNSIISKMLNANIRIVGFDHFHAKVLIAGQHTIVMSANIEKLGLDKGFEIGVQLDGQRAYEIQKTVNEWIDDPEWSYEYDSSR